VSNAIIHYVSRLTAIESIKLESDGALLGRFATSGDEAAFCALLQRHGRIVWAVCRNVLGQGNDAEDAFQATFLVLAQKAGMVRKRHSVASWLHGVARRVALSTRRGIHRRRAHEQKVDPKDQPAGPAASVEASFREIRAILDDVLTGLPIVLRESFVLCCLEGKTAAEAARELGRSESSVAVALSRARKQLAGQLARRGVTLAVALGAASLISASAGATVPSLLTRRTINFVINHRSGYPTGVTANTVVALAERSMTVMTLTKLKVALVVVMVTIVAIVTGTGVSHWAVAQPQSHKSGAASPTTTGLQEGKRILADVFGDPLPRGALTRLGTRRLAHTTFVSSVSFSPDSKMLASVAMTEKSVSLWDAVTGAAMGQLEIDGRASTATFAPDGRTIAIGVLTSQNVSEIQIWNVAERAIVRRFDAGEQFWLGQMAFSSDGKMLASTRREPKDKTVIRLWEVSTGKALLALEGHTGEVRGLAFSPDGRTLASAGTDQILLWDAGTGNKTREIKAGGIVWSVAFSPDGKWVYAPQNTAVKTWDVATGKEGREFETRFGGTTYITLSRDGKSVAASGARYDEKRQELIRCAHIWDTATGTVRYIDGTQEEFGRLAFSPNGKLIASTGNNENTSVRLWDAGTGKSVLGDGVIGARVSSVSFSADGKVIATGERLWEGATGRLIRVLGAAGYFPSGVSVFGPQGILASSNWDTEGGSFSLWNVSTGREERHLSAGDIGIVRQISFSADGRVIACSGGHNVSQPPAKSDLQVRLWETAQGKEIGRFSSSQDWPVNGALSPDGRTYAIGGHKDGSIALWDTVTGKETHRFRGHVGMVNAVAFSPDGKILASASQDMTVGLWDVGSGRQLRSLDKGHRGAIFSVAFSIDGRVVASGGQDHAVCLWEASTGKVRHLFEGSQGSVSALAFSPDGRRLASGSADGTALVWDVTRTVATGAILARLSTDELEALWARLGGEDAEAAHQAVWRFAASPEQTVPFLRGRLKPAARLDAAALTRVDQLLGQLNTDEFATRERASEELAKIGEPALPALRAALKANESAEARKRIEKLVRTAVGLSTDRLRAMRAIEALEHCSTADARRAVEELAAGDPDARITVEAKAAISRLAQGGGGKR
jgi:RNA polymerase sigma factor (sigma-70 family)